MSPSLIKSIHLFFFFFLHLLQNSSEEVLRGVRCSSGDLVPFQSCCCILHSLYRLVSPPTPTLEVGALVPKDQFRLGGSRLGGVGVGGAAAGQAGCRRAGIRRL